MDGSASFRHLDSIAFELSHSGHVTVKVNYRQQRIDGSMAEHAIVVREIKVTPKELGIILFSGDNSSYGTQCVTIPRFHTLWHGNHIFCEVKPYFVSIMAFGSAPAALPQSAHNTPLPN